MQHCCNLGLRTKHNSKMAWVSIPCVKTFLTPPIFWGHSPTVVALEPCLQALLCEGWEPPPVHVEVLYPVPRRDFHSPGAQASPAHSPPGTSVFMLPRTQPDPQSLGERGTPLEGIALPCWFQPGCGAAASSVFLADWEALREVCVFC